MVAPVLGIPLAVKLALNQMKLPPLMGVPLKPPLLDVGVEHGGGGGGPQDRLLLVLVKVIVFVLLVPGPSSVAKPESVKFPVTGPRGFVIVSLNTEVGPSWNGPVEPVTVIAGPDDGVSVMLKFTT